MFCLTSEKKKRGSISIAAAMLAVVIMMVIGISMVGCSSGSGVEVKDSTEAYTWDELSKISGEIAKASDESAAVEVAKKYHLTTADGKLDGTQTKSIELNNGTQTYVQIAGFYHDEKTNGSGKAGITFIFGDVIAAHAMNTADTSNGGWEASSMRSWLALDGMNMLPNDLKGLIVEVKKYTNNVGGSIGYDGDSSSITSTSDKLWLFSYMELCGAHASDSEDLLDEGAEDDVSVPWYALYEAEGQEYQLFRDLGVSPWSGDNQILCKPYEKDEFGYGDGPYAWWERTPYLGNYSEGTRFLNVTSEGDADGYLSADAYRVGVVPGFCI